MKCNFSQIRIEPEIQDQNHRKSRESSRKKQRKCNVDSNDTRLTNQNTSVCPSLVVLTTCWLSPWPVQHLSPAILTHLAGHLFQSSLQVVRRLTKQNTPVCLLCSVPSVLDFPLSCPALVGFPSCEPLPYLAGHLFQSSLLVVQLSCKLSENT